MSAPGDTSTASDPAVAACPDSRRSRSASTATGSATAVPASPTTPETAPDTCCDMVTEPSRRAPTAADRTESSRRRGEPVASSTMLQLLDFAGIYFRAFFAVPASITAPNGRPVNAVRGSLDIMAG